MDKRVEKAVEVFKKGGIVVFPTDTAFGIGCRITAVKTIKKLFKIRRRPKTKAVPVLFSSMEMVRQYVLGITPDVEKTAEKYWPGALTLILKCKTEKVPPLVRGGGQTLGIRIPDNKFIRKIIAEIGEPILGTSANFAGEETPYCFQDIDKKLLNRVDFAINGKTNGKKLLSTVIDCTVMPWKIIREGAIKISNY